MIHGKVFCGFKQCVNGTWQIISWFQAMYEWNAIWQSILLFQAIHVEVFFDFNQYVNGTW
jgi:hypothetical protein